MDSLSVWHWAVVAIIVLPIIYGVYLLARSARRNALEGQAPSGIGGWLLLLVAGLMVLGPLLSAGRIYDSISSTEAQYPRLVGIARWQTYKEATWIVYLAMAAVSIYAGYGLCKRRDWSAVTTAKVALWVAGPIGSIVLAILVPGLMAGNWVADPDAIGSIGGSAIAATAWTLYLTKSKRVRATYRNTREWGNARKSYGAAPIQSQQLSANTDQQSGDAATEPSLPEKLRDLKRLHDEGLISEEVYLEQQRLLLNRP